MWACPMSDRLKLSLALYRNVINGLWSPLLLDHLGDQPYVRNYEAMQRMRGRLQNHPKEVAWCELRTHKPEPSRTAATANATAQKYFPPGAFIRYCHCLLVK